MDRPNANKQHAVPQNIMDVEFKLIGFMTLKQFMYVAVFSTVGYAFWAGTSGLFRIPLTGISGLLAVGLAFVKIQERGLDEWIVNFILAMYKPNQRIWRKVVVLPTIFTHQHLDFVKQELVTLAPTSSRRKLEEYLELQEGTYEKPDKLDYDYQIDDYIQKLRDAYSSGPVAKTSVATKPHMINPIGNVTDQEVVLQQSQTQTQTQPQLLQQTAPEIITESKQPNSTQGTGNIQTTQTIVQQPEPVMAAIVTQTIQRRPQLILPGRKFNISPITPDMHAGRRFTNLIPNSIGEIKLPTRGTKILRTNEEENKNEELEKKTLQLKKLINEIKNDEGYQEAMDKKIQDVNSDVDFTKVLEGVKTENTKLVEEIQHLRNEIKDMKDTTTVNSPVLPIENTPQDQPNQHIQPQPRIFNEPKPQKLGPQFSDMQPLTNKPNIISGIVKGNDNKIIRNTVLVIKDSKGSPVRAIKTNSIGQFIVSSPLTNGLYEIEVDKSEKSGYTFDIISLEVTGSVIPPIEFIGRKNG